MPQTVLIDLVQAATLTEKRPKRCLLFGFRPPGVQIADLEDH